jgi:hypothetical protein
MDYIVASALRHLAQLLFFLFSYDIMCQWSKNLKERLLNLPPHVRFQVAHYFVKFVIPKLHILGHLKFCQDFFSLLFTLGAAQADMEGIERIWSSSGLMGASTREMGPGSRQDTLDDFWHYWNWNKVVGMGKGALSGSHRVCLPSLGGSRFHTPQTVGQGQERAYAPNECTPGVYRGTAGRGLCLEEGRRRF